MHGLLFHLVFCILLGFVRFVVFKVIVGGFPASHAASLVLYVPSAFSGRTHCTSSFFSRLLFPSFHVHAVGQTNLLSRARHPLRHCAPQLCMNVKRKVRGRWCFRMCMRWLNVCDMVQNALASPCLGCANNCLCNPSCAPRRLCNATR